MTPDSARNIEAVNNALEDAPQFRRHQDGE